jgi:cytosine/uracil/thiamine/allantoin permease
VLTVNACISAVVGTACALAAVFAGPRVPERINMDRALAVTATAATAACAWALWHHELAATMLTFIAVTYIAGDLRARRAPDRDE